MPQLGSTFYKEAENARAVAREVIATTLAGKKVRKGLITQKHGYGKAIALNPSKVTKTQSYQLEIARAVQQMELARQRAIQRLPSVEDKASYNHLIDGIDKLTKNIQLLSGHSTENKSIHIEISEAVARKNTIEPIEITSNS